MIQKNEPLDVKNLCSRKLWEILACDDQQRLNPVEEQHIETELIERQHYLPELYLRRNETHSYCIAMRGNPSHR